MHIYDKSQHVIIPGESCTSRRLPRCSHKHAGLSYDHHVCHPRNEVCVMEEGGEDQSSLNLGQEKENINREGYKFAHTHTYAHNIHLTHIYKFKYFGKKWTIAQLKLTDQAGLKHTASSNSLCKKCQQSFSEGHGVCYAQ